jgi:hypothetical protein
MEKLVGPCRIEVPQFPDGIQDGLLFFSIGASSREVVRGVGRLRIDAQDLTVGLGGVSV